MDSERGVIVPTAPSVVGVVTSENVASDPVAKAINRLSSQVSIQIEAVNPKKKEDLPRESPQLSRVETQPENRPPSRGQPLGTVLWIGQTVL